MSAWSPLSLAQLQSTSLLGVVTALRDEAAAQGLADPWAAVAAQVTAELRALIGASNRYPLDGDTTALPASLLPLALKKAVREMKKALGTALSVDEQAEEKIYESRLALLRTGDWPVEAPDNPIPADTVPPSAATGFYGSADPVAL